MFYVARGSAAAWSVGHRVAEADQVKFPLVGVLTRQGLLQFALKQQPILPVYDEPRRKAAAGRRRA